MSIVFMVNDGENNIHCPVCDNVLFYTYEELDDDTAVVKCYDCEKEICVSKSLL